MRPWSPGTLQNFNPRSPHRERQIMTCPLSCNSYFNPRSPHRERRHSYLLSRQPLRFQSTLPSQGATHYSLGALPVSVIFQSTLPSQEATQRCFFLVYIRSNFNPRSPHRERLIFVSGILKNPSISIHAPLTGSDKRGGANDN